MNVFCCGTLRRFAQVSLCLFSSIALAQTQPVFPVLHYDPYAVTSPLAIAEGDINGASSTVYAAASISAGSSILTTAPQSSAPLSAGVVPCTVNSLLLADLNKDSKLDLIATCNEDTVAVLAGNGDGTFQAAATYSVTKAAKAAVADLNGDGYPDLAIATNTGNTTSVFAILLNTASGASISFSTPKVYGGTPSANGGDQITVSDLNTDGRLDVIAGSEAAVFLGNGDGSFLAGTSVGVSGFPALADFDSNGQIDVAAFNNSTGYLNDSVGIIFWNSTKTSETTHVIPGPGKIQALDVNSDGHPDLVLTGSITTVLLNDGNANMSVAGSYATPGIFYTARKGSSGLDLVFTTPRGFYTMHGDGKGGFDGLPAFYLSDQIAPGDLNNDGLTDLIASEPFLGTHHTVIGRGDGSFVSVSNLSNQVKAFPILADFNGDSVRDLIEIYSSTVDAGGSADPADQTSGNESRLIWSKGSADGNFTRTGPSIDLGVKSAIAAIPGDFNGDGNLDLAVSYLDTSVSPSVSGLVLVHGNGDGTFTAPTAPLDSIPLATSAKPLAADLNSDGKLDLVWGNNAYLYNSADPNNPTKNPLPITGTALAVGDLNGDGPPDVIIDHAIYAGKNDGTFQPAPFATIATPTGATLISASIGDLNGDGHPDVVIQYINDMAGFTVAYGDGVGNFTTDPNTYTTGSTTPVTAGFARLNNQAPAPVQDNRLDYLVASDGGVVSLLNQTNPAPGPALLLPTQLSLSASPTNPAPLQPVSINVQLTGLYPTGTVTVTSSDGTVLGQLDVTSSSLTRQSPFSAPGTYTVTASYSGDHINAPSVSSPFTIVVTKKAPTIAISFPSSIYTGYRTTLTASTDAFAPTDQLSFFSGSSLLGTAPVPTGGVQVAYKFPSAGTYSISASYPGDASNLPAVSPTYTVTVVDGPDFSITASPTTNTVKAGDSATYTITVASIRNYSGNITLSCQPVCQTAQASITPNQPATLQFTLKTNASNGTPQSSARFGPIGAAFLLLLGLGRTSRKRLAQWQRLGLFAVFLAVGMISLSGCSSSKSSPSNPSSPPTDTNPGTSYSFAITATDNIIGVNHSVALTLVVK